MLCSERSQLGREKSVKCHMKARELLRGRPWGNSRPAEHQSISPCTSVGLQKWVDR